MEQPGLAPPRQEADVRHWFLALGRVAGVVAITFALVLVSVPDTRGGTESSALATLRALTTAQQLYLDGDRNRNGVRDYATSLAELRAANLVDGDVAAGRRRGYVFALRGSGTRWSASADPAIPGESGQRCFFVDETGALRFSPSGPASATSTRVGL